MALTKISTAMISQSAAAVDLNVDAGTFYVDTTNNRVGVGGKTDPDTPLHVIGTVTATTFAGSGASLTNIPNSALTNSSITINSTATSLGGSITLGTDDVAEGSSNLYYTDARVDARISGGSLGNITTTGYIRGPSSFTIDPAAHGDNTGTVVIAGNLQVDGTTTTINSTTMTVDDKNITLASGSANAAAASGAGFTVDIGSGTNPAITYDGTNDEWDFNKPLNVTGAITTSGNISKSSGDLTLDVAGDIILDADSGVWRFKDAGTTVFQVARDGNSFLGLYSGISDMDMRFQGNDGGSTITALTLDMSAAGAAIFNSGATFGGVIQPSSANAIDLGTNGTEFRTLYVDTSIIASNPLDIKAGTILTLDAGSGVIDFDDNGTNIGRLENASSDFKLESRVQDKDIVLVGNDGGVGVEALRLDMSAAGAATFNAGATFGSALTLPGGTTGTRTIKDSYTSGSIANQGTIRSSGGNYWGYSTYQDGSANWKSAVSIASERTVFAIDEDTAYWSHAPSQTVSIGSDLTTQPTKKIVFDLENGNVGIGASSPSFTVGNKGIHIVDATSPAIRLQDSNAVNSDFTIYSPDGDNSLRIYHENNAVDLFTITSSGSVGIGTSPSAELHVKNAADCTLLLQSGDGNTAEILFGDASDTSRGKIKYLSSDEMIFEVNNLVEAMRIDSSGKLKVGYTGTGTPGNGNTDTGHLLKNDGRFFASSASNSQFNRNSDGDILTFRESGDLVGSIGVSAGDNFYIGATAANHTGLQFADNVIVPMVALSNSDATTDLGASNVRFKDLYLSGTANVGSGGVDISGTDELRYRMLNNGTFKGGIEVATSNGDMIGTSVVDDLAIRSQANILFSGGGNTERLRLNSTGGIISRSTGANYATGTVAGLFVDGTSRGTVRIRSEADAAAELFFDVDGGASWDISARQSTDNYDLHFYNRVQASDTLTGVAGPTVVFTQTGRVGIGTTDTYSRKFVVEGSGDLMMLRSTNSGAGGAQLDFIHDSPSAATGDSVGIINFSDDAKQYASLKGVTNNLNVSGQLHFGVRTDGSNYNHDAMVIDNTGNVGIGTESPIAPLHVVGNAVIETGSPDLYLATTSASHYNWRVAAQESVDAGFEIASGTQSAGSNAVADTYTPLFVLKSSGNVGRLEVKGSTRGRIVTQNATSGDGDDDAGNVLLNDYSSWVDIFRESWIGNSQGWGTFWAGSSGALYRREAADTNPNEYVLVGSGSKRFTFELNPGGPAYFDGTLTQNAYDYAEYFEWEDGNPDNQDRRGFTVVLTDTGLIRKATSDDDPEEIMGAISGTAAVLGDAAMYDWDGKYEIDEWGTRILDDVVTVSWSVEDETGELIHHAYKETEIPEGIIVPEDAGRKEHKEYRLTADYDPEQEYIPRDKRPEWGIVGLLGKVRIRDESPKNPRWKYIKTIAGKKLWLIR
jgi:hypothetical protein